MVSYKVCHRSFLRRYLDVGNAVIIKYQLLLH